MFPFILASNSSACLSFNAWKRFKGAEERAVLLLEVVAEFFWVFERRLSNHGATTNIYRTLGDDGVYQITCQSLIGRDLQPLTLAPNKVFSKAFSNGYLTNATVFFEWVK